MEGEGSVTHLIKDLKQGDPLAAQALWDRYFTRMVRLANAKLSAARHPAVVEGGSDAALDALVSLFDGMKEGKYTTLTDREDLWRLLVVITARKAYDQIERAKAAKRGGGRVVHESSLKPNGDGRGGFDGIVGGGVNPEFAAMVIEQCRHLLSVLPDDQLRDIALWKMEGYNKQEIAAKLECSPRTVAYRLEYIRKIWEAMPS